MPLLEAGVRIADPWVVVTEPQAVPADGPVLVPLARLTTERDTLVMRRAPLGVLLPNDAAVADLTVLVDGDLNRLGLIVLAFPAFKDGRAYTQARQIRETHGYRGRLRATGEVLRDQLLFMVRCGFDQVVLDSADPEGDWQTAVTEIAGVYQPTGDGRPTIPALRRHTLRRKGLAA
ncbi:DUF934 domain-containing protein [Roseospira goensis]|uniref:Uncharacterized protein (DUF934 family) n=1 Tax=Roseospira goensis TaxID=391922 RepID=A0A7W6WJ40_9PROT|nr:DUF934 domain-containing protein [Roseospira goensis]MBB4284806.1 uncharacterized protein (DUF934 family) [Roseospira goensis]